MRLYNLTGLTGAKADEHRTMTVSSFSIKPKLFWTALVCLIPSLALMGIVWAFVGVYAIFVALVVEPLLVWLIVSRTTDARDIPRYRALLDAKNAREEEGSFFVGSNRVDPFHTESGIVFSATTPVGKPDEKIRPVVVKIDQQLDKLHKPKGGASR